MSRSIVDRIYFIKQKDDKSKPIMKLNIACYNKQGGVWLYDILANLEIEFNDDINVDIYIDSVSIDDNIMVLCARSGHSPCFKAYDKIAQKLGLDYFVETVDCHQYSYYSSEGQEHYYANQHVLRLLKDGEEYSHIDNIEDYYSGVPYKTIWDVQRFLLSKVGIPTGFWDAAELAVYLDSIGWELSKFHYDCLQDNTIE